MNSNELADLIFQSLSQVEEFRLNYLVLAHEDAVTRVRYPVYIGRTRIVDEDGNAYYDDEEIPDDVETTQEIEGPDGNWVVPGDLHDVFPHPEGRYPVFFDGQMLKELLVYNGLMVKERITFGLSQTKPHHIRVATDSGSYTWDGLSSFIRSRLGTKFLLKRPTMSRAIDLVIEKINTMVASGVASDTKKVIIDVVRGDELIKAYSDGCWGHSSCMCGKQNSSKVRVYGINGQVVGLANIQKSGISIGRCLIWGAEDGPKFYDRIYCNREDNRTACVHALESAGYKEVARQRVAVVMKLPTAGINIPYFDNMATGARIGDDRMVVVSRDSDDKFKATIQKKFDISSWGEFRTTNGVLGMMVRTVDGQELPVSQIRQFHDPSGAIVYVPVDKIDEYRKTNKLCQMHSLSGDELFISDAYTHMMYQHPNKMWLGWVNESQDFIYLRGEFLYRDPGGKRVVHIADSIMRGGLRIPYRKDQVKDDYPVYPISPASPGAKCIGYIPRSIAVSMKLQVQLLNGLHYILVGDGDWDDAAARDARHFPAEVIVG